MGLLRKLAGQSGYSEGDEIPDILANLQNMLSSRRGYGYFLPNYGVTDYSYLGTKKDIAQAVIGELTELITRYEPRISLLQILAIDDERLFRLGFQIDFTVRNEPYSLKLVREPADKHYRIEP
jgi:type VI secretion system protein